MSSSIEDSLETEWRSSVHPPIVEANLLEIVEEKLIAKIVN